MNTKRMLLAISALVLLFAGCARRRTISLSSLADIIVAQDGSGRYSRIMDAIGVAEAGDIIFIKPGIYKEKVEIAKDDIVLVGAGPGKTIIDADAEHAAIILSGNACTVEGFSLTGGEYGIDVKHGYHRISRCLIFDNRSLGIHLSDLPSVGSAIIEFCTIVGNDLSGIYSRKDDENTEVRYCVIARHKSGIVADNEGGGMRIEYNVLDNKENFRTVTANKKGNIESDPQFVDPARGDYRLKKGSPAINIDGKGTTAGCF